MNSKLLSFSPVSFNTLGLPTANQAQKDATVYQHQDWFTSFTDSARMLSVQLVQISPQSGVAEVDAWAHKLVSHLLQPT